MYFHFRGVSWRRAARSGAAVATAFAGLSGAAETARAKTWVVAANGSGDRPTIQAAVTAAKAGDIIELKDGVFSGAGNRDVDLAGKQLVIRSRSGDASACVIDCAGTPGVPHRAFWFHSAETAACALRNIGIRNGLTWEDGGGVLCSGASPTLQGVVFTNCQAGSGGGLACIDGASPRVEDCLFTGNRSDFGSAVTCRNSAPAFTGCTLIANERAEIGGGVLCERGADATFTRCLFDANRAEIGAGLACRDDSNPQLSECRFVRNAADGGGGEGGGAWCANSAPTFSNCIFASNSAVGHGGAIACAIAAPRLLNCTLYANAAPLGGGVYSWLDSAPQIVNSIIAFSPEGEAVACESGGLALLTCSDVFGNAGGDWTGAIAGQNGALGNFAAQPRFCDASAGILSLQQDSPCLAGQHPSGTGSGLVGALGAGCVAGPSADLSLRKVADRPSIPLGENVTYTITLKNLGPAAAEGITFGDPVPDALNFVAFSSSRGTVTGSYCSVDGSLAPGDSVTATLIATPISNPAPSERWCQNTAYIAARSTPDPNPANDTASAWVYLLPPASGAPSDAPAARPLSLWSQRTGEPEVTRFLFILPAPEVDADLSIYDVAGRRIAVLARGAFAAGPHAVDWHRSASSGGALARGVYVARLRTAAGAVTHKARLVP